MIPWAPPLPLELDTASGSLPVNPAPSNAGNVPDVDGAVTVVGATHFVVSKPASAAAGSPANFTVTALDQFNNIAASYAGTIHFTSSDILATLPADATLTNGAGVFGIIFGTAGNQTLTATDTVNGVTGVSTAVAVSAAAASQFTVSAPAAVLFGSPFKFTVTALDPFGNLAAGYTGTVHFSSSDAAATLPADATLTNSVGVFSATLQTAGSQTLTATDAVTASITGTSNNISPAATHFAFDVPSATQAGMGFLLKVMIKDQFNHTVSSYNGTVHFSSSDNQAQVPADSTITNGVGMFAVVLKTAGNETFTATDSVNASLTGTSSAIAVSPSAIYRLGVTAPSSAATGNSLSFTVVALDPYDNFVPSYNGTVHFGSSDAAAILPADMTLSGGAGTFSATLQTTGSQILTATDVSNSAIAGSSAPITVRGLIVTSLVPTATGFVAQFNQAFDPSILSIYDGLGVSGPADVTVDGPSGAVRGSLLLNSADTQITFVKTDLVSSAPLAGVLAAGTYTVTLRSAVNGFQDSAGGLLDGNDSGTPGVNYVATFVVASTSSPVLSIPDFARGPDSAANVELPNATGTGIPITLANAIGVTSATFQLDYNPALLDITGALNGPSGTFTLVSTPSGGVANFSFQSATALSGSLTLGQIVAQVPNSAAAVYKSKALLHLSNISLNGGNSAVANDDGVQVDAYLGDVLGDGTYSPLDASLIARVATDFDSGFAAFGLLDPAIIGDLTTDGFVNSTDVTLVNRWLAGFVQSQFPPIPTGLTITPTGPDPILSLPTNLDVVGGATVIVPVNIDTAMPAGSTGMNEAVLALQFNPQVFTVSAADVQLGTLSGAGSGWQLQTVVNAVTGQIGIDLYSLTPIQTTAAGSLVTIAMHVRDGAVVGSNGLSIVTEVDPNGERTFRTTLADAQGALVVHMPLPSTGQEADALASATVDAVQEQLAANSGPKALMDQVFGRMPDVANSSPLSALAYDLQEQVFSYEEEMLPRENAILLPSASYLLPTAEVSNQDLAQLMGLTQHDWVPPDLTAYLGQVARAARRSRLGEASDTPLAGQDEADL